MSGFSIKKMKYSLACHETIREVYEHIFTKDVNVKQASVKEDTQDKIDFIASIGLVSYAIQERFRPIEYKDYNDFTFTMNKKRCEFTESLADFFIYGYHDEKIDKVAKGYVVNLPLFKLKFGKEEVKFEKKYNRSNNSHFVAVNFNDIKECILYEFEWNGKEYCFS